MAGKEADEAGESAGPGDGSFVFTDEQNTTRIVSLLNGQLAWRPQGRPGDWYTLKPPIKYDPRTRSISAIGFRRSVQLPLHGEATRRTRERLCSVLRKQQMVHKGANKWFPGTKAAAVNMEEVAEAEQAFATAWSSEPEGASTLNTLTQLAALADRASEPHRLLPKATLTRDVKLRGLPGGPCTDAAGRGCERVTVLSVEGRAPRVLRVASQECRPFTGDYFVALGERVAGLPVWERGGVRLFSDRQGGWVFGWDTEVAQCRGHLRSAPSTTSGTSTRFPHQAEGWQCADGKGGWVPAPGTSVRSPWSDGAWALISTASGLGYVRLGYLQMDQDEGPRRDTDGFLIPPKPRGVAVSPPPPPPSPPPPPMEEYAVVVFAGLIGAAKAASSLRVVYPEGAAAVFEIESGAWSPCTILRVASKHRRDVVVKGRGSQYTFPNIPIAKLKRVRKKKTRQRAMSRHYTIDDEHNLPSPPLPPHSPGLPPGSPLPQPDPTSPRRTHDSFSPATTNTTPDPEYRSLTVPPPNGSASVVSAPPQQDEHPAKKDKRNGVRQKKRAREEKPKGWVACESSSGKIFYYNTVTKAKSWKKPPGLDNSDVVMESKKRKREMK